MPATLVGVLRDHRRQQQEMCLALGRPWTPDELVFGDPVTGAIWPGNSFTTAFARIAKQAGVSITVHGLRHEHFSRLLAAGEHPKVCQLRAGHSSIAVTMDLYSHASEALQQAAASRMENVFRTLREQSGGNRVAKPSEGAHENTARL